MGKRITDEEIKLIGNIRQTYQDIAMKIGQLELQASDLKAQKKILIVEYAESKHSEKEMADNFVKKYGQGSLDPKTWEFVEK